MSAIKIEIKSEGYKLGISRTAVYVDGKFAYQTANTVALEHEDIQKIIELAHIDNVEVISIYSETEK